MGPLTPTRRRGLTGLVVWWLVVAAVVPGVVAGATLPGPADGTSVAAERAVGTTVEATALPGSVAAGVGDGVDVDGTTTFESGTVRLYLVGPRGTFLDSAGAGGEFESETVVDGTFSLSYASFSRRGTYRLLVVSPRADGSFESTGTLGRDALPTGVSQRQAVDVVRAAYGGDEVIDLTVRGESPRLGVDPLTERSLVRDESATVTGTSNRGDGTAVSLELLDGGGRVAADATATVDATRGTWEAELDLTGVEPGAYTLYADDGEASASTAAVVVGEEPTPTETPSERPGDGAERTDDAVADARGTVDDVTGAALANATDGLDAANETVGGVTGADAGANGTTDETTNGTANASADAAGNGTTEGMTNGTANASAEGDGGVTDGQVPGFGVGALAAALVVVAARLARSREEGGSDER